MRYVANKGLPDVVGRCAMQFAQHTEPEYQTEVEAALGFEIRVVAVGTGQALKNAELCDGDLLLQAFRRLYGDAAADTNDDFIEPVPPAVLCIL